MNLREFLTDAAIQLPVKRTTDDFQGFVDHLLDTFLAKLAALDEPADVAADVKNRMADLVTFCEEAKKTVQETYKGHPHAAYDHFVKAVSPLDDLITSTAIPLNFQHTYFMYRVRSQEAITLNREDLFHIPFEKRHLVATQRYSIPGLPCLYLGGSLYTCWAEMGRPPFHELHAAAFWLSPGKSVKILNLSSRPKRLLLFLAQGTCDPANPQSKDVVKSGILLWPLIALCSVVVKYRTAAYKPEYTFPQLVLQWVSREHSMDGLCYFSTHVDAVTGEPLPPCNLVFPAKLIKAEGRCSYLRDTFRMTDPYNWQLLSAIQAGQGVRGGTTPSYDFEFVEGRKEPYGSTEFGMVEAKLNKLGSDTIQQIANGDPNAGMVLL